MDTANVIEEQNKVNESNSYIELKKMAKGYGWNIKAYDNLTEEKMENLKKKIEALDVWLTSRWGE